MAPPLLEPVVTFPVNAEFETSAPALEVRYSGAPVVVVLPLNVQPSNV